MRFLLILTQTLFCFYPILVAQRVTIQFDAPPTNPSVSKAVLKYNKDFAYSFTFDDGTDDAYTAALPALRGGLVRGNNTVYPALNYTDGCGNDIPFRAGVAWNTANPSGIDLHNGDVPGYLTWKQLDTLYDLGWDVMNHSFSHRARWSGTMAGDDYVNEIERNRVAVQNKTRMRLSMPLFVVPAGDTFYNSIAYRQGHELVFNQPGETIGFAGLPINDDVNLYGKVIHRMLLEESLATVPFVDRVAERAVGGAKFWYNEFTHRIDNFDVNAPFNFPKFYGQMKKVFDTYGKNGNDRVWMAPLQEVYEYLVMRRLATYTTSVQGSTLVLNFDLFNVPRWLRRRTLSLVVNANVSFNNVVVPNGVKVSFKGIGNAKLINLDFTDFKTTSVTETTPSVLKVFPNPTGDVLTIELPTETPVNESLQVTVYDSIGKVVINQKEKNSRLMRLNTEILRGGNYWILVRQGSQFYRSQFVRK
jgi:hypothetical protein